MTDFEWLAGETITPTASGDALERLAGGTAGVLRAGSGDGRVRGFRAADVAKEWDVSPQYVEQVRPNRLPPPFATDQARGSGMWLYPQLIGTPSWEAAYRDGSRRVVADLSEIDLSRVAAISCGGVVEAPVSVGTSRHLDPTRYRPRDYWESMGVFPLLDVGSGVVFRLGDTETMTKRFNRAWLRPTEPRPRRQTSDDELLAHLVRAANDGTLSASEWNRYAADHELVTAHSVRIRFKTWTSALEAAGLTPRPTTGVARTFGDGDCLEAVVAYLGECQAQVVRPTVVGYDQWARADSTRPSISTVRNRLGTWSSVVARAATLLEESDHPTT